MLFETQPRGSHKNPYRHWYCRVCGSKNTEPYCSDCRSSANLVRGKKSKKK